MGTEPEIVEQTIQVSKTARYYQLGHLGNRTREVWIVCHGYGQLARRFIRSFASIVSDHRAIVAPEALHRFYLDPVDRSAADRRVGATWMTREARDADIADYIAYLDRLVMTLLPRADLPLTVLGFSQGTATVARWVAATERRVEHLILWGSGLPPDLDWNRAASRFRGLRMSIVAGKTDAAFPPERVRAEEALLQQHGLGVQTLDFEGAHTLDATLLQRLTGR